MTLHQGPGLTQAANNCFVHAEAGSTRPRYLVGVIHRQGTGGRELPPDCLCGFNTADTPFAKGHIMALELGGSDASFNIVPQYERWQGNPGAAGDGGTWRDMELALSAGAQQAMVVEIDYAAVPEQYLVHQAAFRNGAQVIHWTGPNIPTRFRVWGVTQATVQAYLDADDAGKEAAIGALILARHGEAALFDAAIGAMPAIDRRFWKRNMVRAAARRAHLDYFVEADRAYDVALNALPVAAAGGGGVRRISRGGNSPYARPAPVLPPKPSNYAVWSGTAGAKLIIVNLIRNNTGGASADWTPAERLAFDTAALNLALT